MTARRIPPEMQRRDGYIGEWDVWTRLREDLPDGSVLLCNVKVPQGPSGRQIDFLVLWPGVGIAVVEVKGGTVCCDAEGRWSSQRAGKSKSIGNPMEQAATVRHELHRFLSESGYAAAKARIQHLVVLPHQELPASFNPTSCPRRQVVDCDQLPSLVPLLRDLVEHGAGWAPLTEVELPPLVALFEQQLQADPAAVLREHESESDQRALRQVDVLDLLSRQRSFTVVGGAGTGKTVLAVEQAKRLATDGKRVALVCYSRGLAQFLQREAQLWKRPPSFVGTFERLARENGAPEGEGNDYYEQVVPRALRDAAAATDSRFDAVVVDEAQDFGDEWWPALTAWLADPEGGGVFAFLDEGQRVFERRSVAPVDGQPYPLRRNYRNTRNIAQTFGSLELEQARYEGRPGTRVRYVACPTEEAVARADDAVDALLDVWEPGQIALLTTQHRHPEHKHQVERLGDDGYWEAFFAGDDVFYGSVAGFKGLERTCVVLAVNGFSPHARVKEMLYVGLSRARSQLVVVGDLDVIATTAERGGVRQRLLAAEPWNPPALS